MGSLLLSCGSQGIEFKLPGLAVSTLPTEPFPWLGLSVCLSIIYLETGSGGVQTDLQLCT